MTALLLALALSAAPAAEAAELQPLPGGTFRMGTDEGLPHEGPSHRVTVSPFAIDRHEVTNARFARFVAATAYVTEAEKIGWAGVFRPGAGWQPVNGASWKAPGGPNSSVKGRDAYPVVHVSWNDARAFCAWAGKRLPTEAEFEFAARSGKQGELYAWGGRELAPGGRHLANTWQGPFPERDTGADGFRGPAPVGSFPANGYGLFDVIGNVWEWTADGFDPRAYRGREGARDPRGPVRAEQRAIRGGSWICTPHYCSGYRVAARQSSPPDSALDNLGFRCAADAAPKK